MPTFLPAEIDDHYHPEMELLGDLAHALWMLTERVTNSAAFDFDFNDQRPCREEMAADFAEYKDDVTEWIYSPPEGALGCTSGYGTR